MAEAKQKKSEKKAAPAASAASAAAPGEKCQIEKCKQPVRAKGLCRKHYLGWRRGKVGKKHRYNTCSKEGCRKRAIFAGRCEEHRKGAGKEAAAAAA